MFIHCNAYFRDEMSDVEYDLLSNEQRMSACSPRAFRFRLEELVSYNAASDPSCTTIRLKNGWDIITDLSIKKLDAIIDSHA